MTRKNQSAIGAAKQAVVTTEQLKSVLTQEPDFLQPVVQAILEVEMDEGLQAGKYERTDGRLGYRSGYYRRRLITRVGTLMLRVPQDRAGTSARRCSSSTSAARRRWWRRWRRCTCKG